VIGLWISLVVPGECKGAGIAQLERRLVTDWTVRGSISGAVEIFRIRPDRLWDPPSLL
jgi:hypothetical protein